MAGETMALIKTITAGVGGTGSFDFTAIPQTFTDLIVVFSGRSAYAAGGQYWTFVLNTEPPSLTKNFFGTGTSVSYNSVNTVDSGTLTAASSTTNIFSNATIYVPNYTSSSAKFASIDAVSENNGATAYQGITGMYYSAVTSPVTSLSIGAAGQTMIQYSSASLYGILKGSGGATVS